VDARGGFHVALSSTHRISIDSMFR